MLIHHSRYLTRGEVWFDEEPTGRAVDWILYRQRPQPAPRSRWRYFYTRLLDLRGSPEALLASMSHSTAYKIRRARDRDRVMGERLDPCADGVLDQFEVMYRRFAASRALGPLDRPMLNTMAAGGVLDLSVAREPSGPVLVYHLYYRGRQRSSLLFSTSLYQDLGDSAARNALGRANCLLFWTDFLRFKEQGLTHFDFGGWYTGHTDAARLSINRFKEGFGGAVVREYNCERILSWKAWAVLTMAQALRRARAAAHWLELQWPRLGLLKPQGTSAA